MITVYKSQGLTLPKVVLNIDQKEHYLGLLYVAISWVKALHGLMFECPFDFNYFSRSIDSNIARDREIDHNYRNKQLL